MHITEAAYWLDSRLKTMHSTGAAFWSYSSLRLKPVTTGPLQHQAELLQHRSFSIEINKLSLYRCWPWYLVPHFCVKFCFIVRIHLTVHACTIFITIINFLKSQGWTSCGCTAGDPSVSETSSNEQGQDSGRAGPNYRQCRPAPVSSHQGSGRAGPEESVCITHK